MMEVGLQEYQGIRFLIEFVQSIHQYKWFRIYMPNGLTYNVTIESEDIEQARQQVLQKIQEFLEKQ